MVATEPNKIIIGSSNTLFAQKLKQIVEQHSDYNVIEIVVLAEHLLETLEQTKKNGESIFAVIITSDLAQKGNDRRLEFLSDCLCTIRTRHSDVNIALLSNEEEGHPFLAELVGVGIYNIFIESANERINVLEVLEKLVNPKQFSDVAKYRTYRKDILWRKVDKGASQIKIVHDTTNIDPPIVKESDNNQKAESNQKVEKKKRDIIIIDDELEDFRIPLPPPQITEKIVHRDRIYGSPVIAVMGTTQGVGVTHFSISLANYLAKKGNSVAVVECNESDDFKYIELSYEGIKNEVNSLNTVKFEIDGVDYYKSEHEEFDLVSLLSAEYNFIILDIGLYDTTQYFEEFLRSNIQVVVGSSIEWKQRHLIKFMKDTIDYDHQSKWKVVLPLADNQSKADIKSDLKRENIYAMPYQSDPFSKSEIDNAIFDELMGDLPGRGKQKGTKNAVVILSLVAVSIVLLILLLTKS